MIVFCWDSVASAQAFIRPAAVAEFQRSLAFKPENSYSMGSPFPEGEVQGVRKPMRGISRVLMCFLAIAFLMTSTGQSDEGIRKELLKNIRALWQAWQSYNPEPFKRLMSPDAVIVTAQGSMDVSEFLEQLSSKICQVKSFSVHEAARLTKIDDNTYVITYKAEQDAVCAGTKSPSPVLVSEVWSKKDGEWKAYFYQETDLLSPV